MVVKEHQPELHNALDTVVYSKRAWDGEQAEQGTTFSKGHGRHEWRTLERRAVAQLPWDWPGVQQVMRRHTVADLIAAGRRREEVCVFADQFVLAASVSRRPGALVTRALAQRKQGAFCPRCHASAKTPANGGSAIPLMPKPRCTLD